MSQSNVVTPPAVVSPPSLRAYAWVTAALVAYGAGVFFVVQATSRSGAFRSPQMIGPLLAMVAEVAVAWLLMVIFRNYAVLSGVSTGQYFERYVEDPPPDWVERPARAFNNMMQVPVLFYVVCLLTLVTDSGDAGQLWLAWLFVVVRAFHATVYIAWNHLPCRFGSYVASTVTVFVLFARFAMQMADLWLV